MRWPSVVFAACLLAVVWAHHEDIPLAAAGAGAPPSAYAELAPYGIWVAESESAADDLALAGAEPRLVIHRGGGVTGSDAISIAEWRWPGAHVVRELKFVAAKWIAVQASE